MLISITGSSRAKLKWPINKLDTVGLKIAISVLQVMDKYYSLLAILSTFLNNPESKKESRRFGLLLKYWILTNKKEITYLGG